jgi:chromosome segregation ATPase
MKECEQGAVHRANIRHSCCERLDEMSSLIKQIWDEVGGTVDAKGDLAKLFVFRDAMRLFRKERDEAEQKLEKLEQQLLQLRVSHDSRMRERDMGRETIKVLQRKLEESKKARTDLYNHGEKVRNELNELKARFIELERERDALRDREQV